MPRAPPSPPRVDRADALVCLGSGAVIDAGKAEAALAPAAVGALPYLEVVGEGRPLEAAPLPFGAIPSTAGTGAEVTKNAVLSVPECRWNVSLRRPRMLAGLAVVNPALTDDCPRPIALASGPDAITEVIEPSISPQASPLTDALGARRDPYGHRCPGAPDGGRRRRGAGRHGNARL